MATPIGTSGDQVALTREEWVNEVDVIGSDHRHDIVDWRGERWKVFHFPSEGGAHLRRLRSSV